MYTQLLAIALMLQMVHARPQVQATLTSPSSNSSSSGNVTILSSEFVDMGDGSFRWAFETSDGFKAEQTGQTAPPGMEGRSDAEGGSGGGEIIRGSYSYKDPEGKLISVTYVADENGFQPMGDHLPTSPPNPHANLTSLIQPKTATVAQSANSNSTTPAA